MGVCDPICLFYTILLKVLIDVTLCQGAAGLLNERYYFISSAVKQEFLLKWIVFYKSIDDLFTFKPLKMLNVWFNSNHFDCYSWEMLEDYLWWYTAPMPLYETDFRPLLAHIWLVWGNPSWFIRVKCNTSRWRAIEGPFFSSCLFSQEQVVRG